MLRKKEKKTLSSFSENRAKIVRTVFILLPAWLLGNIVASVRGK